jgi:hypothetical protein
VAWDVGCTVWIASAGGRMKAFFAMFLEFQREKIIGPRNYDCLQGEVREYCFRMHFVGLCGQGSC